MRSKALVIGARPSPWEGPWISIEDREEWLVLPAGDYRGLVGVQVIQPNAESPVDHLLNGNEELVISGERARVILKPGVEDLQEAYESVSVNIRSVD